MAGDDEEAMLRSTALQNAQAILSARKRADDELRRTKQLLEEETRILEVLNHTGAVLASQLDLQGLVQAVTDAATQVTGAQFGAFFYTVNSPAGGSFMLYALSGAPREAFDHFGHPRATPLFGPTFQGQAVTRIADVSKDPRYGQLAPHFGMPKGHLPVCSYLATPVKARSGTVVGGLFFGHADCGVFTEKSERLLVGIAAQAAIAIDNAGLYEEARRAADAERAARAEVERVSLMKDEFLATLSHELRTPLNAILGWSEMLRARAGSDDNLRRGLETISRNARAQAQLIEDLLDMNRIVSGKIRLDVQAVSLIAVVEAAVDTVRPSADAKAVRLVVVLDPGAGPVQGDPHRLQQVVWNLLSNAVKFTPKEGRIDVRLQRVNSHVEITITDSGIGIDPAVLPHVFERFRQADSSTTRAYGGLGLGLSIVKQLVELHGGTVRADSAGRGHGATFVVALPLRPLREDDARVHPVSNQAHAIPGSDISLAGLTVLVVDDDPDARELVRTLLARADAAIRTAASADEALELLRGDKPDLLLCDIGMPGRDGYQLIRAIRALPVSDGGKIPAIALTAFARSEDRTRALLAGFQVHVAKPIDPQELVITIASLMGRVSDSSA